MSVAAVDSQDCLSGKPVLDFVCTASGSSSAVERQLPKLDVAGSIPVSRSIKSSS
jgi:hypothetical protein